MTSFISILFTFCYFIFSFEGIYHMFVVSYSSSLFFISTTISLIAFSTFTLRKIRSAGSLYIILHSSLFISSTCLIFLSFSQLRIQCGDFLILHLGILRILGSLTPKKVWLQLTSLHIHSFYLSICLSVYLSLSPSLLQV